MNTPIQPASDEALTDIAQGYQRGDISAVELNGHISALTTDELERFLSISSRVRTEAEAY